MVSASWAKEDAGLAQAQGLNERVISVNLTPPSDVVEALAEIEHEQWQHWSQAVATEVCPLTREKWRASWVEYNQLTEEMKEADRLWARKVVTLLRRRRLIK
jgi:hypothetical protein